MARHCTVTRKGPVIVTKPMPGYVLGSMPSVCTICRRKAWLNYNNKANLPKIRAWIKKHQHCTNKKSSSKPATKRSSKPSPTPITATFVALDDVGRLARPSRRD